MISIPKIVEIVKGDTYFNDDDMKKVIICRSKNACYSGTGNNNSCTNGTGI